MSIWLLYLLVVSISTGIFYNTLGEKFIFFLMILLTVSRGRFKFNKILFINTFVFLFFVVIKSINGRTFNPSGDYHGLWVQQVKVIELAGTFIMCSCLRKNKNLWNEKTIYTCVKIFNICYYSTILLSILNLIIRGRLLYRSYSNNIGIIYAPQFFLFYAIIMAAILTEQIIKNNKKRIKNLIALFINALFVFLMSYTTQMVFFFLTIIMVVIFEIFKKKKAIALCTFLSIILFLLAPVFLPSMILSLNARLFSNNPDVSLRLVEIAHFLSSGDFSGEAMGERIRMIQISKETFMKYFYFGVPFAHYNNGGFLVVGGHQEWIDNLARYGLIGFILFSIFIVSGFKWGIPIVKKNMSEIETVLIIIFVIYGFFNPFIQLSFVTACIIGCILKKNGGLIVKRQ